MGGLNVVVSGLASENVQYPTKHMWLYFQHSVFEIEWSARSVVKHLAKIEKVHNRRRGHQIFDMCSGVKMLDKSVDRWKMKYLCWLFFVNPA